MKKLIIKCFKDYNLVSKYHIIIFDKYNKRIYEKNIDDGMVELFLKKDVYKLLIIPLNIYSSPLLASFIVNNNTDCFNICLKSNDNSLKITAILVDKYYNNLPIERGEIKLWQDHTQ